tara:strand:- start:511 stop:1050 length:540 start_codon:yes stop_codon:yes gene_type:complete
MPFDLSQYQTVAERLSLWLESCKERNTQARVVTDLVERAEGWCLFKATLYENDVLVSTGWAEEHATERGVNATSHVENCETSAVGRALANAGWAGSDPAKRASREEMSKVQRNNPITGAPPKEAAGSRARPTEKMQGFLEILNARKGNPINNDELVEILRSYDATKDQIDRLKELPDVK